jgi:hypothetical protein
MFLFRLGIFRVACELCRGYHYSKDRIWTSMLGLRSICISILVSTYLSFRHRAHYNVSWCLYFVQLGQWLTR